MIGPALPAEQSPVTMEDVIVPQPTNPNLMVTNKAARLEGDCVGQAVDRALDGCYDEFALRAHQRKPR